MNKYKVKKIFFDMLVYLLLFLFSLGIIIPVLWIVLSSFKAGNSLYSSSFFPEKLTTLHYVELFTKSDFLKWYLNTFRIALLNMILAVVITTMTAYGFSRYKFRGKKATMITILVLQMFPSILTMIAIFIVLDKLGLINSYWGLVLVYLAGQLPYNAWLIKGYLDGIPKTLDEAAKIDGASEFMIFYRIVIPLAKPILVLVALNNFMTPWFDFIFPKLILKGGNKTLAVGIFEWIQTRAADNFTMFAAAAMLVAVPITLLFIYLQKHIVEGLAAGAVKG